VSAADSPPDIPTLTGLNLPARWEARLQLVLLEPHREKPLLKTASPNVAAPPRANIMLGREGLQDRSLDEVIEAMRGELVRRFPRHTLSAIEDFAFDDGTVGRAASAEVELPQGLSMVQRFVARGDGGLLTTFVATVSSQERARLDGELRSIIASFCP